MSIEDLYRAVDVQRAWLATPIDRRPMAAAVLAAHPDLADYLQGLLATEAVAAMSDAAAAPVDVPRAGERFGDYRIERRLGAGGMGQVFLAADQDGQRVALKLLAPHRLGSTAARERFRREVKAAAHLRHPGICELLAFGEQPQPWLAMRFVDGPTLRQRLAAAPGGRFAWRAACGLLARVAAAVQCAHDAGVVHRDLKPENILLDAEDAPVVIDFGIAYVDGATTLTQSQDRLGTQHYMAPEQIDPRRGEVAAPTDVFALGAILHELLTGELLFPSRAGVAVTEDILERVPPPPSQRVSDVPAALDLVVGKATAKHPGDRYRTAAAFGADLERLLTAAPVAARALPAWRRARRWCQRHPLPAGLIGALGLLVGGLAVVSLWLASVRDEAFAQGRVVEAQAGELRTRSAEEVLQAARMRVSIGDWAEAERLCDLAASLGAPFVPVQLALAEVHDGRLDVEHYERTLDMLGARSDLGGERGIWRLLRYDPNRMRPRAGLPDWRRELRAAVAEDRLDAAHAAYANALLAERLDDVELHLTAALRADPRYRAAHEMLVTHTILTRGIAEGERAAHELARLYPEHPGPRWVAAFCALCRGDRDGADRQLADDDFGGRACRTFVRLVELHAAYGRAFAAAMVGLGLGESSSFKPALIVAQAAAQSAAFLGVFRDRPSPLRFAPTLTPFLAAAFRLVVDQRIKPTEVIERARPLLAQLSLPALSMKAALAASQEGIPGGISTWLGEAIDRPGLFAMPRDMTLAWLFHVAHDRHEAAARGEALAPEQAARMLALVQAHVLSAPTTDRELAYVAAMFAMAGCDDLARSMAHRVAAAAPDSRELPLLWARIEAFAGHGEASQRWLEKVPPALLEQRRPRLRELGR